MPIDGQKDFNYIYAENLISWDCLNLFKTVSKRINAKLNSPRLFYDTN